MMPIKTKQTTLDAPIHIGIDLAASDYERTVNHRNKGCVPPEIDYSGAYPPNIDAIEKVFPMARKPGVVFAYGKVIYVPSGKVLSPEILRHELVHCTRQQQFGLDAWWDFYLRDDAFRYNEELLAHRAEYKEICEQHGMTRQQRKQILKHVAKKLSAALYGKMVTFEKAKKDLLEND